MFGKYEKLYNQLLKDYKELEDRYNVLSTENNHYKNLLIHSDTNSMKIKCLYERDRYPFKQNEIYEAELHPSATSFGVKFKHDNTLSVYMVSNDKLFKEYFEIVEN